MPTFTRPARLLRALAFLVLAGATPMSHAAAAPGLDAARLAALGERLHAGELPGVHSVIVQQHGSTVAEWHLQGTDEALRDRGPEPLGVVAFGPDTLHDVRSVTKSVVSLLFGIAQQDAAGSGASVVSLDAPVLDAFPEHADLRTPARLRIRARDLLSMTSGWHWDEWSRPYTDPLNSEIAMDIARDPHRYVLEQAIDVEPGMRWSYSGGDVALVGALVAKASGQSLDHFARTRLFEPMGIRFEWSASGSGERRIPRAASGLRLSARDMAKLGQLVLQRGKWQGRQLVPAEWIDRATTAQATIAATDAPGSAYGYLWWLGTQPDGTAWIAAIGNGGQRIWIVPSRGLVIVVTAGNYNLPTQGAAPAEILDAVLAAAAQAAAP